MIVRSDMESDGKYNKNAKDHFLQKLSVTKNKTDFVSDLDHLGFHAPIVQYQQFPL